LVKNKVMIVSSSILTRPANRRQLNQQPETKSAQAVAD
jgi:hypothetical protein